MHASVTDGLFGFFAKNAASSSCEFRSGAQKVFVEVGSGLNNVQGNQREGRPSTPATSGRGGTAAPEEEHGSEGEGDDDHHQEGGDAMHHHQSGWFVGRDVPQHLPQATTAEGVLAMGADAGAAAKQRGETGDAVAFARARARKASLKLVPFFRRTPATMKFDSTAEGIAISSQGLLMAEVAREAGLEAVSIADKLVAAANARRVVPCARDGIYLQTPGNPFGKGTAILDAGVGEQEMPSGNLRSSTSEQAAQAAATREREAVAKEGKRMGVAQVSHEEAFQGKPHLSVPHIDGKDAIACHEPVKGSHCVKEPWLASLMTLISGAVLLKSREDKDEGVLSVTGGLPGDGTCGSDIILTRPSTPNTMQAFYSGAPHQTTATTTAGQKLVRLNQRLNLWTLMALLLCAESLFISKRVRAALAPTHSILL